MGFLPSESVPDGEYLLTRSTTEATLAANARTEQAAAAHRAIASCYLAKLFGSRGAASLEVMFERPTTPPSDDDGVGSAELRFSDLKSIPDNDELTRILTRIQ